MAVRKASSPKLLDTDPKQRDELENVLKQFAANPKQKKLVDGAYVPCYGLTCIMPLRKDIIERWAVPFHKLLAADPVVTSAIVLLPPSSYHVTLRGLEPLLHSFKPEHILLLFDSLRAAQSDLLSMFRGLPISMSVDGAPRPGGLGLGSGNAATESLLRAAEEMIVATLLAPAAPQEKDSKRRQRWHLTLGYTKDRNGEAAAQQRIGEIAKSLKGYPEFVLDPPQICTYRSMEHFAPLFSCP